MWCIGMSEPDNGSDVAGLRTRAVRDGDDWIVTGQKVWTSGAAVADWIYLIARTDPDAPPHAGLSEFVVDMRSPGIEVRRIVDMTGNDHFCEVHLHEVRVPGAHLVGELNGSFRQVMRQMEHERGGIDRLVSNRLLFEDVRRSGWVDTADPLVRQELAALEIGYRIGRLLVLRETLGQAPQAVLGGDEDVLHRVRAAPRRLLRPRRRPVRHAARPRPAISAAASPAASATPRPTRSWAAPPQILRNILGERVLGLPR